MIAKILYHLRQPLFLDNRRDSELIRLAEFGRVSAGLIHEMSTPLSVAALSLDQLKFKHQNSLIRRARRELKLIERYVAAARKQLNGESNKRSFSLTIAIHQVVMLLSGKARNNKVKILVSSIGSVRLYGDPVKFHQLLANLLSNAIDAYDGIYDRPKTVNVKVHFFRTKSVVLIVEDSGQGIDKKDIKHIFEPFFSTKKNKNRGLGLGLASVKQFVELDFKGKITVKSKPGVGTRFTIRFPIV